VAATRNAGVTIATGEYLAFLDEDDMWLPAHVRPHLALLRGDPNLGGVMGQICPVGYFSLRPLAEPFPVDLDASGGAFRTLLAGGLQIGALIIRASAWDAVGPFDTQLAPAHTRIAVDDWDWYLRLAHQVPLGFVQEPCIRVRIRPPSLEEDTLFYNRQPLGRRVFWTNVRRAGRSSPSLLAAERIWLKHDGSLAGMLLTNAGMYADKGNPDHARQAAMMALRVAPLRISWGLARSSWIRGLLWPGLPFVGGARTTDEQVAS
jgi:hypothetical protein